MPRISAATVSEHREQLHRRIFAAFTELLREEGYDALTMAQLAERAGLSRTAIYHHFPDKIAVVVAYAGAETDSYVRSLEERLADAEGPAEALRTYVEHALDDTIDFHMGLGALVGRLPPESREQLRRHVLAVEEVLRRILDDGVRAGVFTVPDPATTMTLIHACVLPRRLPVDEVAGFVLRAVSASPGS